MTFSKEEEKKRKITLSRIIDKKNTKQNENSVRFILYFHRIKFSNMYDVMI